MKDGRNLWVAGSFVSCLNKHRRYLTLLLEEERKYLEALTASIKDLSLWSLCNGGCRVTLGRRGELLHGDVEPAVLRRHGKDSSCRASSAKAALSTHSCDGAVPGALRKPCRSTSGIIRRVFEELAWDQLFQWKWLEFYSVIFLSSLPCLA